MDVTPLIPAGRQLIQGYGDGGFRISGRRWEGSVLVCPTATVAWAAVTVDDASMATLAPLLGTGTELLLLGSGQQMAAMPRQLKADLRAAGIVLDVMDTGAACRTYNVLLSEDRKVAAALIAV